MLIISRMLCASSSERSQMSSTKRPCEGHVAQRHCNNSSFTEKARKAPFCESLPSIRSHIFSEGIPIITACTLFPSKSTKHGSVTFKRSSRSQSFLAIVSLQFSWIFSTKEPSLALAVFIIKSLQYNINNFLSFLIIL